MKLFAMLLAVTRIACVLLPSDDCEACVRECEAGPAYDCGPRCERARRCP